MRDSIDKHGIIRNIVNRGNQFINNVEPNLNIHFNKPIYFDEPFVAIIVRYKIISNLKDNKMKSYELPPCDPK